MKNNAKVLYSLGYELGQDWQRQELALDREPLIQGIEDALARARPKVRASERQAALQDIKRQRAQANLDASEAFLSENGQKEDVITLPSGLQYRELEPGDGKSRKPNDRITVNYRGTVIDGSEFDSSYEQGKPSTIAMARVIRGWP